MSEKKDNEKDELLVDDVKPLIEEHSDKTIVYYLLYIFIACSLSLIFHSIYSMVDHWQDNSIPLTICPTSYDLDSPVIMKALRDEKDPLIQDRWVRGFVRKVVLNSYPRTAEDAPIFFEWMMNNSTGKLSYKYKTFLNSMTDIQNALRAGSYINFYAKDDLNIKIRKADGNSARWTVEIDGFLVKNYQGVQQRLSPTLKIEIVAGKPTRKNPSGLYVIDMSNDLIADYVSGRKINVD